MHGAIVAISQLFYTTCMRFYGSSSRVPALLIVFSGIMSAGSLYALMFVNHSLPSPLSDVLGFVELASVPLFLVAGPVAVARARKYPRDAVRVMAITSVIAYLVDGTACWYWLAIAPEQDVLFYPWWPELALSILVGGPLTVVMVELVRAGRRFI